MIGQELKMECLKCSAPVTGGGFWRIEDRMGFLCEPCEEKTRAEIFRRYDEEFAKFGIPTCAVMMSRSTGRSVVRCADADSPAWIVRCAPLRPRACWTVAILPEEKIARTFAAFYGNYVYTEVRVMRVDAGEPREGAALDRWERSYSAMRRPAPPLIRPTPLSRPTPRPFRRPFPPGGNLA
jgi:hypothetical protein